jgi:3-hydroxyisobutyrate dehydrogenase-like beta-hydroxyacid dehydrogenase
MTAIVWYGLGVFGLPMACRCAESGYQVRAGSDRGRVAEFVHAGGLPSTADTEDRPIVALCLPSGAEVLDVVRTVEVARYVVDFTSHSPASAEQAAAMLRDRGIGYVDCPVSGSVELAREGRLTAYLGARTGELDEDVQKLVNSVCENVFWTGGVGRGQAMKLVNQVIHIGNVLVLGEGFELADQLGLDDATVLEALRASSGSSRMLERFGAQMLAGHHPRQFSARLASKDIANALRLTPDLPVTTIVAERLRALVESGRGEDNFTRLATRPTAAAPSGAAPARKAVVLLDELGFATPFYTDLDGRPMLPPDQYDVRLITTVKRLALSAGAPVRSVLAVPDLEPEALRAAAAFQRNVDGVRCSSLLALTERLLLPAAVLREQLDIPGDRVENLQRFRDEVVMKQLLRDAGIRVPHFAPYTPGVARDLLTNHGTVVVKPRAGAGSRNVHIVTAPEQLRRFEVEFDGRTDTFEVEEFIDGQLYHVDSVVEHSRVVAATAGRGMDPTTTYETLGNYRDVNLAPGALLDRLLAFNQRVLASCPDFTGVAHHEVLVTGDEVVFRGIAPCWGGGGIRATVHHNTGVDLIAAMVRAQLGEPIPAPTRTPRDLTGYVLVYVAGEPMRREFALDEPWVVECEVRPRVGEVPRTPVGWGRATARIVVRGENESQVMERLAISDEAVRRCFR